MQLKLPQRLYLIFEARNIALDPDDKLIKVESVDHLHRFLYFLNYSSLNRCGKIKIFIRTSRDIISISPIFQIPSSLKEFRKMLKHCLLGLDVKSGETSLMQLRKNLPDLPDTQYFFQYDSRKVIEPHLITESLAIFFNLDGMKTSTNTSVAQPVRFSQYPLEPLQQCASILHCLEEINNIQ